MRVENIEFSVVIPTRNRIELLKRAVNSVRKQGFSGYEIVIIDNCSDVPIADLDFFRSSDVKVIRNSSICTAGLNRNIGIAASKGQIICFLDDDDEYYSRKFNDLIESFTKNEDIDFIFGNTDQMGSDRNFITQARGPCDIRMYLKFRHIHLNSLAIRKHVFQSIKFSEDMEKYQDVDFIGRLMRMFQGMHVDYPHSIWYRDGRADQVTRRNLKLGHKCWKRLCITFESEITSYPDLNPLYLNKMIYLCFLNFDYGGLLRFLGLRMKATKR